VTTIRPDLASLPAYVPGRAVPGAIKLASNEVPLPPHPAVLEAVAEAAVTGNRYPDLAVTGLTARIASSLGVEPSGSRRAAAR
jgi:histidinol-phosphate aminotransferase